MRKGNLRDGCHHGSRAPSPSPVGIAPLIVPLDGSTYAEAILPQATTLALASHASVLLAAVPSLPLLEEEILLERYSGHYQQHLLMVTTREQAEHQVMRFLHQSHVPVLFVAL
jgi:hypothetical protein